MRKPLIWITGTAVAAAGTVVGAEVKNGNEGVTHEASSVYHMPGSSATVEIMANLVKSYNADVAARHASEGRKFLIAQREVVRRGNLDEWGLEAMKTGMDRAVAVDHFHADEPPLVNMTLAEMKQEYQAGLLPAHNKAVATNKPVEIHFFASNQMDRDDGLQFYAQETPKTIYVMIVRWSPNPTLIGK